MKAALFLSATVLAAQAKLLAPEHHNNHTVHNTTVHPTAHPTVHPTVHNPTEHVHHVQPHTHTQPHHKAQPHHHAAQHKAQHHAQHHTSNNNEEESLFSLGSITSALNNIGSSISSATKSAENAVSSTTSNVISSVTTAADNVGNSVTTAVNDAGQEISTVTNNVGTATSQVGTDVSGALEAVASDFQNGQSMIDAAQDWTTVNWQTGAGIAQAIQATAEGLNTFFDDLNTLTGGELNETDLESAAAVLGLTIPDGAIVIQAGEVILNLGDNAEDITSYVQGIANGFETKNYMEVIMDGYELFDIIKGAVPATSAF